MKTLYLVRHGTSNLKSPDNKDENRPLSEIGRQEATALGGHLFSHDFQPQLILVSTAQRTQETAQLLCESGQIDSRVCQDKVDLYNAQVDYLMKLLRETPDDIDSLMLVGHNPGLSHLIHLLSTESCSVSMQPGAMAVLQFTLESWGLVSKHCAQLLSVDKPALAS